MALPTKDNEGGDLFANARARDLKGEEPYERPLPLPGMDTYQPSVSSAALRILPCIASRKSAPMRFSSSALPPAPTLTSQPTANSLAMPRHVELETDPNQWNPTLREMWAQFPAQPVPAFG